MLGGLAAKPVAALLDGARRSLNDADALKALRRDAAELRADGITADAINAAFAVIEGWIPR